jgi:hypothetical protein
MKGDNLFGLRMKFFLAQGFFAQKLHDLGKVNFLGTARQAGLAGKTQPDGKGRDGFGFEGGKSELKHPENLARREVHFRGQRATRGTLPALVALGHGFAGELS